MGTGAWGMGHGEGGEGGERLKGKGKRDKFNLSPLRLSLSPFPGKPHTLFSQCPMPHAQYYLESVSIIGRTNQLKPTLS